MNTQHGHLFKTDLQTAASVLKAALHCWHRLGQNSAAMASLRTFVTVSRQPGAGGFAFAQGLVERLNGLPCGDWTAWDNELFDRVWLERSVQEEVIQVLAEQPLGWLQTLCENATDPTRRQNEEFGAYQHVAMMLRALAMAGHTVLVGRGGQFITEQMRGGIHLRLVAPLEHRIKYMMDKFDLTQRQAASRIAKTEHDRELFYHRFWKCKDLGPETFALTLNAGELTIDEMVESVLPLIRMRESQLPVVQLFGAMNSAVSTACC